MASLQPQLLHPFHFYSDDSFLHTNRKINFFPPKFESVIALTATNLNLKRKFKLDQNSLQITQINSVSENPKNEVDCFESIVNKFMAVRNCKYDCKQVHCMLVKLGAIELDYRVGNRLALMYLKRGDLLSDARKMFDQMPERMIQLYAVLVGSYCRAERWGDAFSVLRLMVLDEMLPDIYLIPMILKACGALELLRYGKMIHGFVLKKKSNPNLFVGNGLIDFYANCGELRLAKRVFFMMQEKDVVSWTALVYAYMDEGLTSEAHAIFHSMQLNGLKPDLISWNTLVSGFARNGDINLAFRSLDELQEAGLIPKVSSWNALISGCVRSGYYNDAFIAFSKMLSSFEKPNAVTLVSILTSCASLKAIEVAKIIHGYAIKSELSGNIYVQGSLIDMYSKCVRNDSMEKVFKHVKSKNTPLWNEMIAAYVNEGKMEAALGLLESMRNDGLHPDKITYNTLLSGYARKGNKNEAYALISEMENVNLKPDIVSFNVLISGFQQCGLTREALKLFRNIQTSAQPNPVTITGALAACADLCLLCHGKEFHGYVIKNNFGSNVFVSSALVDMYARCHDMSSATKVFHGMENRNTVSWNSFFAAHISNFHPEEALKFVPEMLCEGINPSLITYMTILPACGDVEALILGKTLHGFMVKTRVLDLDDALASILIDMYARCNCISHAKLVFDSMNVKDVVLWNVMIFAYSAHGMAKSAINSFEQMKLHGIAPDNRTFIALLSAFICNRLVVEGWKYYELMQNCYGISANLEHYGCMVSIMGAAGLVDEALDFIERMPCVPDASFWANLLQVCKICSNHELGKQAEKSLQELQENDAFQFVLKSKTCVMPWMRNSAESLKI